MTIIIAIYLLIGLLIAHKKITYIYSDNVSDDDKELQDDFIKIRESGFGELVLGLTYVLYAVFWPFLMVDEWIIRR